MTGRREIQLGESYEHDNYGRVEVTGIWKGVNSADTAHETDDSNVIIVRYSSKGPKSEIELLTDTLDEFIENTE